MPRKNMIFRNVNDAVHLTVASRLKNGAQISSLKELRALYDEEIEQAYNKALRAKMLKANEEIATNYQEDSNE